MDVVTPTKGKKPSKTYTKKKEGNFPWRHSGIPRPREFFIFHLDVDLSKPKTSPL
jgi:hypothetical protein